VFPGREIHPARKHEIVLNGTKPGVSLAPSLTGKMLI
jgi:hypothetical protein